MKDIHPRERYRTWIEIDARSLFFNFSTFKKRLGQAELMLMVKSNAYGHGLVLVAKLFAARDQALWFGADSIIEALRLRREGIKNPILVLGYTLPRWLGEATRGGVTITIAHRQALEAVARLRIRPKFHLKFDTGMHRQGFQEHDLPTLLRLLKHHRLDPQGVYSHLAMAENKKFSHEQIARFSRMVVYLRAHGITPLLVHFNKTEGILRYPQARFSLERLGIGLYGYTPGSRIHLRSALTWKAIVAEIKHIPKGDAVSYDLTERVKRDSIIAVLPIGYWHGFDRGLSSTGSVLIHGQRAKVLGRVTMDMTMVDVTTHGRVRVGDEVVLIGAQGKERISADEVGVKINTTAYEVLTRINPLIKRIVH